VKGDDRDGRGLPARGDGGGSGFAWRYVPPNLVTAFGLALGLLSIVAVIEGRLTDAAWLILFCVLVDQADGFVARLFNATSAFGVQMDSFSDLVTFGVCPAVLVAGALLGGRSEPPTLIEALLVVPGCALYVICAAARLARFNLLTDVYGPDYFFGFATTLCGAIVPVYFLIVTRHFTDPLWVEVMPGILAVLGLLMVSNVPLPKVRRRKARWLNIFQMVNVVGVYLCGLARAWPEYLGFLLLLYLAVGGTWCQIRRIRPPARGGST